MRRNKRAFNLKPKFTFRRKMAIVAFALYLTFILLSCIPYIAESHIRSRQNDMDTKYDYHLIFREDGTQTHYYAERHDTGENGEITLTYTTSSHTLDVTTTNIKKLTINSEDVYYDECQKVFKVNPYLYYDPLFYIDYFKEDHDKFTVIVKTTDYEIEELRFVDAPEPVSVLVDGEEWWTTDTNYAYNGDDIVVTSVPTATIELYFKERIPPNALFSITGDNAFEESKKSYGYVNKELTFDAKASNDDDDDGTIEEYNWKFSDGSEDKKGETVNHQFSKTGSFNVTLTVTDNYNLEGLITKEITIVESENDLDLDGMDDAWERKYKLDDPDGDEDKDGVSNLDEFVNDANPNKEDTDDDGYSDYDEIFKYETEPNDPESKPTSKESGEDNTLMMLGIVAIVLVILILLVLFALIRKRKKKAEEGPAVKEGAVEGGGEGEDGPAPPQVPSQMPMWPGQPPESGQQPMYQDQYPPYPPGTEGEVPSSERPYSPESGEDVPLYKTEEESPYGEMDEEISHEDLALDIESMRIAPEEGIAGIDEGLPPEAGMPEEEVMPEDLPLPDEAPTEEEVPSDETPEEEKAPPEPEEELDEDLLDLGDEELVEEKGAPEDALETQESEKPLPVRKQKAAEEDMAEEEESTEEPEEGEMNVRDYVKNGAMHFRNEEYTEAILEWQKALDIESDHPEIIESIKEAMAKLQEQ